MSRKFPLRILIAALLAATLAEPASAMQTQISGSVRLRDGDTPVVGGVPVRLSGLTCDERGSQMGDRATARLWDIIGRQHLTCVLNGETTYDRQVGRCYLPDGRDIAEILISEGYCGRCARYDPQRTYVKAQRHAGRYRGAMPGYCRPR
ncbi:thermonuclease family protein [Rhodovulum sulfidophilum]|uniref:thermonuclease family protein n=1 Tax=Rhodovulum sulfidophilum TaxID=35806 RepID=UPI001389D062|nr:thermonuclease family protein [Rhodovulum sulfidophilum]NDK37024.1 thermonuclease family protein [Rhodovulum sulfidophilum]